VEAIIIRIFKGNRETSISHFRFITIYFGCADYGRNGKFLFA